MGFYLLSHTYSNIIDAYVGATLYDFNVSDELGGNAKIDFRFPFTDVKYPSKHFLNSGIELKTSFKELLWNSLLA